MQIELYKFSKRINSTKRPVAGSGFTTQCTIKQNAPYVGTFGSSSDTTVCYPVLFLTGVDNPNEYNYVKAFGDRYYFIRDIQIDINGAATLHCEIDALATRKNEILSSNQYVEYASNGSTDIDDPRIVMKQGGKPRRGYSQGGTLFPYMSGGTYILQVMAASGSGDQFIKAYAMGATSLGAVATAFTTDTTIQTELQKYFNSPYEALRSLHWTPLNVTDYGQIEGMYLGNAPLGIAAANLSGGQPIAENSIVVPIPRIYTDIRKGGRYSSYGIYVPFCGSFRISGDDIYDETSVTVNVKMDTRTGDISGAVRATTNGKLLTLLSGNAYTEMPIGQLASASKRIAQVTGSFISGVARVVSSSSAAAIIGNGISAAESMIESAEAQAEFHGGGVASAIGDAAGTYIEMYVTQKDTSYTPGEGSSIIGLPVFSVKQLSSITGYCKCKNPSIEINDLKEIAELINRYLSGGFFIE